MFSIKKTRGFGLLTFLLSTAAAFLAAIILVIIAPQPLNEQQTENIQEENQNIQHELVQDTQKIPEEGVETYPPALSANPSLPKTTGQISSNHTEPLQENTASQEPVFAKSEVQMPDISTIIPSLTPIIAIPELNERIRPAVVNILCTSKTGGLFKPVSGSGVIIDPRGIILTNAHLAQYFLLKNYQVENFLECIVRQGSPAEPRYRAELLYISPEWIQGHAHEIKLQSTKGTGEHDFALVRVTMPTNPAASLPTSFPFIEPEVGTEAEITLEDNVLAISYPAELLGGIAIQTNLALTSTVSQINDLFTYSENTLDVIGVGGSIVSQKGSSGGAIVRQKSGQLTGLIALNSSGETTDDRALRALTLSYINRALEAATGGGLKNFLDGDLALKAAAFNTTTAPELTNLLEKALE